MKIETSLGYECKDISELEKYFGADVKNVKRVKFPYMRSNRGKIYVDDFTIEIDGPEDVLYLLMAKVKMKDEEKTIGKNLIVIGKFANEIDGYVIIGNSGITGCAFYPDNKVYLHDNEVKKLHFVPSYVLRGERDGVELYILKPKASLTSIENDLELIIE